MELPSEPEPVTEEEPSEESQDYGSEEPELDDFEGRRANMMSHYHNVTTCTLRLVQGVPLEWMVAVGESDRDVGKGLADGGANTCVVGAGWKLLNQTQHSALIQGFSEYLTKQNIPIMSAATVVDLPNGESVILQAHEALYLPNNKFTILSSTQLREHGVAIDDTA